MLVSLLITGLNAEQISLSRLGTQMAVEVLPSSSVHVGPWWSMSPVLFYLGDPCTCLHLYKVIGAKMSAPHL